MGLIHRDPIENHCHVIHCRISRTGWYILLLPPDNVVLAPVTSSVNRVDTLVHSKRSGKVVPESSESSLDRESELSSHAWQRESKAEVSRHCLFVSTVCISQQNQQLDLAGGCNAIHGTLWFGDRTRTTFELPMTYSIQTGIGMLWACC